MKPRGEGHSCSCSSTSFAQKHGTSAAGCKLEGVHQARPSLACCCCSSLQAVVSPTCSAAGQKQLMHLTLGLLYFCATPRALLSDDRVTELIARTC